MELENNIKEEKKILKLKDGRYFLKEEQNKVYTKIVELHPFDNPNYRWVEMSIAEIFSICYNDVCLYCPGVKSWITYKEGKWIIDKEGGIVSDKLKELVKILVLYATQLPGGDSDKKEKYRNFVNSLYDRRNRDRILKDAKEEARIDIEEFDKDPYIINCKNGTYNLKTKEFSEHNPSDHLMQMADCEYVLPSMRKKYNFPRWKSFVEQITCHHADEEDFLMRAIGYSIFGTATEDCMFFAYGKTTRNGKGTLFNTIEKVLGAYATSTDVSLILKSKFAASYSSANPMLVKLRSARFVLMSESEKNARLNEADIKRYTGGDTIQTRDLYVGPVKFTSNFKMWLMCNNLPNIQDKTLFASDRIVIIPFSAHFDDKHRDKTLREKFLTKEAKGTVFMWLIECYNRYERDKLENQPSSISEAVKKYEIKSDTSAMFVEECCVLDENKSLLRTSLYTQYVAWCQSLDYAIKKRRDFYEDLEKITTTKIINGYRYLVGIGFKENFGVEFR